MSLDIVMFALGLFLGGIIGTGIHLWHIRRLAVKSQKVWHDYAERIREDESGWGRE